MTSCHRIKRNCYINVSFHLEVERKTNLICPNARLTICLSTFHLSHHYTSALHNRGHFLTFDLGIQRVGHFYQSGFFRLSRDSVHLKFRVFLSTRERRRNIGKKSVFWCDLAAEWMFVVTKLEILLSLSST